jgi:hypothetical protein
MCVYRTGCETGQTHSSLGISNRSGTDANCDEAWDASRAILNIEIVAKGISIMVRDNGKGLQEDNLRAEEFVSRS